MFDFGGGTLDITIADVSNINGKFHFNVVTTSGDTNLGGKNFDSNIYKNILIEISVVKFYNIHIIEWGYIYAKHFLSNLIFDISLHYWFYSYRLLNRKSKRSRHHN